MRAPKLFINILFVFFPLLASSQAYFQWSEEVYSAFKEVQEWKLSSADIRLSRAKLFEKNNLLIYYVEQYAEFLSVFVTESTSNFQDYKVHSKSRLKLFKKGPIEDPYYLYVQGQVHLQNALLKLKFVEYLGAFNEISKAYELLEYNEKKYPDFYPNQASLGVLRAAIGTIPDEYRWGANLLGLYGSISEGRQNLKTALSLAKKEASPHLAEIEVMYALVLLHLIDEPEESWDFINNSDINASVSPLGTFIKANIAMHIGKNDMAIDLLERRPRGDQFSSFHFLDYMLGTAKLYRLDSTASSHLENFVQNYQGRNYVKDAYRKMGWCQQVFHEGEGLLQLKKLCKAEGASSIDVDKSALKWAKSSRVVQSDLLRARISFDGGYFIKALQIIEQTNITDFDEGDILEYHYRLGRIFHKQGKKEAAINKYQYVLENFQNNENYRVGYSAYQLGIIYESLGDLENARYYYELCRDIKVNEYSTSLNQKAKAGLERIKGR